MYKCNVFLNYQNEVIATEVLSYWLYTSTQQEFVL